MVTEQPIHGHLYRAQALFSTGVPDRRCRGFDQHHEEPWSWLSQMFLECRVHRLCRKFYRGSFSLTYISLRMFEYFCVVSVCEMESPLFAFLRCVAVDNFVWREFFYEQTLMDDTLHIMYTPATACLRNISQSIFFPSEVCTTSFLFRPFRTKPKKCVGSLSFFRLYLRGDV